MDDDGNFQIFPATISSLIDALHNKQDKPMVSVSWICDDWGVVIVEEERLMKHYFLLLILGDKDVFHWGVLL